MSSEADRTRITELEQRLADSEETIAAIRRGDFDAVVVEGPAGEQLVYTLENADRPYRVLIEQIQEGAITLTAFGTVLYCNRRLATMLRSSQERVIGQELASLVAEEDVAKLKALLASASAGPVRDELLLCTPSGDTLPVNVSLSPLECDGVGALLCGIFTDLSLQRHHMQELADANSRLKAESAERTLVEDALRQAQKMEAVGQLTGGLAHDFNNLLAGISGSLEMMQTRMSQGRIGDLDRYMAAAQGAARRAAALTHRLLAFSRRQTLDPKPTDVNRLVNGMEELIRRTVGPAISMDLIGAAGLWFALIDPGQLENALLNLCINARDAMPEGGRITVETANRWMDVHAATERDLPVGQYLSLSVTDTGTGMPPEVITKAFDPFFTTKPLGQGTGLGLSMIYGFVRQSGGQVRIYSEIGQGTTVCLYLPRHVGEREAEATVAQHPSIPFAQAGETVLIVDDEPTVRMLVTDVLEDLGYVALEAPDSAAGLKVLQSSVRIDLLITDVGLPGGMNGRQMADAARVGRPSLKVLFITGYAENAAIGNGRLAAGMEVMTKPFAVDALASKIKGLIDAA